MAKVVHLSEIKDTSELFSMRSLLLGNDSGDWFVIDDDLVLGRWIEKSDAQDHANALINDTPESDKVMADKLAAALEFAEGLEDV